MRSRPCVCKPIKVKRDGRWRCRGSTCISSEFGWSFRSLSSVGLVLLPVVSILPNLCLGPRVLPANVLECPDEPQKAQVVEEDEEAARAVPIAGDSSWRRLRWLSSRTNAIWTAALSRSSLSNRDETNEL